MKACPKCENPWDDGKRFCPYHGLPLVPLPEPVAVPADAEVTARMSEQERVQLFTPQFPVAESPSSGRLSASAPAGAPEIAAWSEAAVQIDDPPTLKSQRQKPPPEPDTVIPPTVIVSPAAAPPEQVEAAPNPSVTDTFIPPTVVVAPAEVEAIRPSQAGVSPPATSRTEVESLSGTIKVEATHTVLVDPSATHFLGLMEMEPAKSPASVPPPAAAAGDDVGFILDLEKSSTRLPPPPQAAEPPPGGTASPVGRSLTPSAVPSLVTPPSPTLKRRTAVQYFKLFNERKKVMQQFVHGLDPRRVHITEGHSNQEELLMHRYDLTFRYLVSQRTFPLVIILQRKPVYDLMTSVDLYEIGESPRLREERTKLLGGECKPTPNGVVYHVSYAEDLPTEQFGDWLQKTFQEIAKLLPGLSFP
ncbi:hypothetical protein [Chloracidobacterium thermophilum]|uniref:Uncharacterized protein n=1 Tax=Chloracidobacterium thermophilum (strain B) TaxID=981222 RepID=G2LLR3_CHLTF|nr:hypothetical protein [Chloracidobacterium thermophilum]AEP13475.1 hypothetical protein Cabther_B0476 [Chloracidobacterium thermophilum B]QUV79943.1 hypothetical protein J8C08_14310 [Chloracidobacterium thermophilum]